jgi:hypothetical protein
MTTASFPLSFLFLSAVFAASVFGQTAQLTGTVTDQSGSVIPAAKVVATNVDTGVARSSLTNDAGNYLITALLPGRYTVTSEATGFKQMKRDSVSLAVDQVGRIDFSMEVGGTTDSVTVEASAVLLDAATSTVGSLVENRQVIELPLNGRSPMDLVALSAGIRVQGGFGGRLVTSGTPGGAWSNFSFNGGLSGGNAIMVEGLSLELAQMNSPSFVPPPDATQEFRVQTNKFAAEYSRTTGAVVNFSIKSGTNQLHGSLYEFFRNRDLNANNFFQNRSGAARPPFNQNQFGGAVGGPIQKDKTFFFANFEEYRQRVGAPALTTVPTALERVGNFSQTRNGAGNVVTIADPTSTQQQPDGSYLRTVFPGNIIPESRINKVAASIAPLYPLPTLAGAPFTGVNNFLTKAATAINEHQIITKIDHNLNARWKVFGTYARDWLNQNQADPLGLTPNLTRALTNDRHQATLSATAVFSPGLIGEFHTGLARVIVNSIPRALGFDITTLGLPKSLADQTQIQSFPGFQVSGLTGVGSSASAGESLGAHNSFPSRASLTWVKGSHTIKTGGDYRIQQMNQFLANTLEPVFNFTNQMTAVNPLALNANSGVPMASFLLGTVSTASVAKSQRMANERRYLAIFVQDDWKITRKLTLNIGTDYSLEFPITERYNRKMWFDRTVPSPLSQTVGFPLVGGFRFADSSTRGPIDLYKKQFGPRIGFAYQLTPRTVIRSGFGLFWVPASLSEVTGDTRAPAWAINTPMVTTLNGGISPYNTLDNPFPQGIQLPPGSSQGLLTLIGQDAATNRRSDHTGYMQQWNFDIQRDLGKERVLEVTYSGSAGVGLPAGWSTQINQVPDQYLSLGSALQQQVPNPFASVVTSGPLSQPTIQRAQLLRPWPQFQTLFGEGANVGHSSYHSFQAQYKQRFGSGSLVTVAYTVSKAIGNSETRSDFQETGSSAVGSDGFADIYNRGLNRSLAIQDTPQRLVVSYTLELPFGPGKRLLNQKGVVGRLVGGWEASGVYTAQIGPPLATYNVTNLEGNFTSVTDVYGTFNSNSFPSCNGTNPTLGGAPVTRLNQWFNTSTFSQPAPFTYGTCGRTMPSTRADGINNLDLGVFKNNKFGHDDRFNLQFRGEFFNVANHARFGFPGLAFGNATFGVVSTQLNNPRQIQMALKLLF